MNLPCFVDPTLFFNSDVFAFKGVRYPDLHARLNHDYVYTKRLHIYDVTRLQNGSAEIHKQLG